MNKFSCLIVILLFPLTALANVLTLYALPSAKGLDYSTPRALFLSTLKNSFERRDFPLGHMFVEIKCQNQPAEMATMTGEYRYLRQLFFEGRGLGILFQSVDGKLLEGRDVSDKVSQFLKEGKLSFINYQLNEGQCLRVTKYLKEYRENNVGRNAGLVNRPLFGEGGSSGSFGVSFLEVLGLLETDYELTWKTTLNVPLEWSGPPLREERVNFLTFLMSDVTWATGNVPHKTLSFWDPEKIDRWIRERIQRAAIERNIVLTMKKSQGILMVKSHLPASEGTIWRQFTDPAYRKSKVP